jgi:hypothetical protein
MPIGLRFIMSGCFIGVLFAFVAFLPFLEWRIDDVPISFSEFWRRGGGPLCLLVGILLPVIGYGLATARNWSRYLLMGFGVVGLTLTVLSEPLFDALMSFVANAVLFYYLFWRHTVRSYFRGVTE